MSTINIVKSISRDHNIAENSAARESNTGDKQRRSTVDDEPNAQDEENYSRIDFIENVWKIEYGDTQFNTTSEQKDTNDGKSSSKRQL